MSEVGTRLKYLSSTVGRCCSSEGLSREANPLAEKNLSGEESKRNQR